jgi:hypothetical protein
LGSTKARRSGGGEYIDVGGDPAHGVVDNDIAKRDVTCIPNYELLEVLFSGTD